MNKIYESVFVLLLVAYCSHAEMRAWTSKSGKVIEGEYVSVIFDNVQLKDANGDLVKIPLDQFSDADRAYIELLNPPTLSIDYQESAQPREFTADPWFANGGGSQILNHPIYLMDASFGALIKQKSSKKYNHDLTVEMYILTEQNLDPDKYHIIGKVKSEPFRLTKENKFRHVYTTPETYKIIYYNLYSSWKRGEKPSKYLILVRDELGNIIEHKGRSEWLFKNLDKLEKLPVGAWINDKCIRVHPTSPPRTRRDQTN